jgi:hypothetical protein
VAASTKFGAQELESGAISPSLVEQQLEGDKVADLISSQLCGQDPELDLASSFNFSSFLLSWFYFPMEAILIFRPCHCGGWKGGLLSPFPSCAKSKMTLGHNPKG